MKKLFFLLALPAVVLTACNTTNPTDYNDNIIKHQKKAVFAMDELDEAVEEGTAENIEKTRVSSLAAVDSAITNIEKIKPMKDDEGFHEATLSLLKHFKKELEVFTPKRVSFAKDPLEMSDEEFEQYLDEMDEYYKIGDDLAEALDVAQEAFAKKHNIKLEDKK